MTTQIDKTQPTKQINYINLTPDTQSKIVDQVLTNASGVGLGMILTILGLLLLARWMGINNLIMKWVEKLESDAESFRTLANSVQNMSGDTKTNHSTYVADHNKIIDQVREVKEITKEILMKVDKV
ncbi:hypothetical protein [Nostoc sp. ChiQUE01b]|uniref:hypothetical protein n=1 Tax=Nostoc sp. ChiQUE01b TaxID=3075376 RepID=UPI002AD50C27|nr:hypothetical protein [Nostoc sp. ChiQUE01b]MDZ8259442.1 hypothetical protein [Nostoc sp. ChiQUE01b]